MGNIKCNDWALPNNQIGRVAWQAIAGVVLLDSPRVERGGDELAKKCRERGSKPGSVTQAFARADDHLSVHDDCSPPQLRPTRMSVAKRIASRARTSKGSHHCTLFGLAPDGVYQADRVTSTAGALLPHRFTLTTRQSRSSMNDDLVGPFGGLFSAALSLASRPVDVIDHPILRSPDFPPVCPKALQRSSCPLTAIAQNDRSTRSRQGSSLECLPSLWIMIEPSDRLDPQMPPFDCARSIVPVRLCPFDCPRVCRK